MKKNNRTYKFSFFLLLISISFLASSQFYNGHQMTFGKNRVQYGDFYWKFYRFDRYDVYSYEEGAELSLVIADIVEKELPGIERFFDYTFENRLIFICYNTLSDFRQSNIGQEKAEEDDSNTGGVTRIIQNKVFLYFEGDRENLRKQIIQTISEALIYEMLYGNDFRSNVTNSTLINIPEWYLKGLVSYMANNWDFELENRVKDGILSGRYEKFNRLTGVDALYAGHSFWKYIADTYGESVIPNILYLTKINKNTNQGFLYVLGFSIKDLSNDWLGYYMNMFNVDSEGESLSDGRKILNKTKRKHVYQQVRLSPDGENIAWVTNELGQYKIWIQNKNSGKKSRIIKGGHRIDQITDFSYPILAWHPTGQILAFLTEEKGLIRLNYYNLQDREITSRIMLFFHKIVDFSFSHDGLRLAISAVYKGQTDIYVHTIASASNERITDDLPDDFNPRFINNSREIIFTSNRKNESLLENTEDNLTNYHSVFIYDYVNKPAVLKKITERPFIEREQPFSSGDNKFIFLSDESGIRNRYQAKYDSTIAYIDTVVHYRYFANTFPITNYKRNIIEHDYVPSLGKYAELLFNDGRYEIFEGDLEPATDFSKEIETTAFRQNYFKKLAQQDSINNLERKTVLLESIMDDHYISGSDTIEFNFSSIDINNYVFEAEKLNLYNSRLAGNNINLVIDTLPREQRRRMYIDYETSFYPNYLVSQLDFSFLNASYQTFTGGAVYYNPGLNFLFKVGAKDLFEDYRIVGGIRLSTDFDSNEYLFSVENLRKRLDKQFIFHRQVFQSQTQSSYLKTFSHEAFFILKYPINQVSALKGTGIIRHDKTVFLSVDYKNLNERDIIRPWIGLKGEYIYDGSRYLGINLYQGLRYKIFAETYKQVNAPKTDMYVVGGDFRHYTKVHRTFIWANRFAASSSFGNTPLIYYLGSLDNWTNFLTPRDEVFDRSVPIDYSRNYAYQTLATNMRGFIQNIRNGNNFAVINSELRLPVIRYLANYPLSSSFWNNLQLVGFFDIGTAWSGLHPWEGKNAYDKEEFSNGPVSVVLDSNREPIVAGYGWGVRSQIFGYFVRLDWAWGIENQTILPRIFYLSLNLDF
jgi:Tol biopolymer transport system component